MTEALEALEEGREREVRTRLAEIKSYLASWETEQQLYGGNIMTPMIERFKEKSNFIQATLTEYFGDVNMRSIRVSDDFSSRVSGHIIEMLNKWSSKTTPSYVDAGAYDALRSYTDGDFDTVNESLRKGGALTLSDEELVRDLTTLMRTIEDPFIVYRGVKERVRNERGEKVQAGDVLHLDSFTSTSRNPLTALPFSRRSENGRAMSFMEILPSKNAKAISLDNEDTKYEEDETLFGLGQLLIIDKVYENVHVDFGFGPELIGQYIVARLEPSTVGASKVGKVQAGTTQVEEEIRSALNSFGKLHASLRGLLTAKKNAEIAEHVDRISGLYMRTLDELSTKQDSSTGVHLQELYAELTSLKGAFVPESPSEIFLRNSVLKVERALGQWRMLHRAVNSL